MPITATSFVPDAGCGVEANVTCDCGTRRSMYAASLESAGDSNSTVGSNSSCHVSLIRVTSSVIEIESNPISSNDACTSTSDGSTNKNVAAIDRSSSITGSRVSRTCAFGETVVGAGEVCSNVATSADAGGCAAKDCDTGNAT